ncbi:hypothetical protein N8I77_013265 [Diaporthe amygdali]|nr:hypothetical protein N8I77_013265 [Diaporthe amygdali]
MTAPVKIQHNFLKCEDDATFDTFLVTSHVPLGEDIVKHPADYIQSLPSKRIRSDLLVALNTWYNVPKQSLHTIDGAIALLHNSSLIGQNMKLTQFRLDDIQDSSVLRRGKPTAHTVFGISQTINSAYYNCFESLGRLQSLSPVVTAIYIEELKILHLGQGHELHWTYVSEPPSEEDYIKMCDAKTSGLFRMMSRMMRAEATTNNNLQIEDFMTLLGRYFQIRDDYQNLVSGDYRTQKGLCEDLDEGKYSLPVIHALKQLDPVLQGLLQYRKQCGGMTTEMKYLAMDHLGERGSLLYTEKVLRCLEKALASHLAKLDDAAGLKNSGLAKILLKLQLG